MEQTSITWILKAAFKKLMWKQIRYDPIVQYMTKVDLKKIDNEGHGCCHEIWTFIMHKLRDEMLRWKK